MSQFDDDLKLLAVKPSYDRVELKAAYHLKARDLHPDAGGDETEFDALVKAYRRLELLLKTGKKPCAGCRGKRRVTVTKGFRTTTKPCGECR